MKTYEEILSWLEETNYIPSGRIRNFPIEVIARMCHNQYLQGKNPNPSIFIVTPTVGKHGKGFDWDQTEEGSAFWAEVISNQNFARYFEKYPFKPVKKVKVSLMDIADWKECEVDDIEIVD